ncbi:MAG: polysaccharide biosynthesis tyrosine autokinase [Actinomycetia bacterium]|nr:polysaccharide biosynthesis tyrosine autokinase [Actinomycetes bacterium]
MDDVVGDELDLFGYARIIRRRIIWFLVPLIAIPAAAVFYTQSQDLVYEAKARVLLNNSAAQEAIDGRLVSASVRDRELANEINLAQSDEAEEAFRATFTLGPDDPLPDGTVTADSSSDVLEFTFQGPTAEQAALATNTWAVIYVDLKQKDASGSIDRASERLRDQLDQLRLERESVRADLRELEIRRARANTDEERAILEIDIELENGAVSGELNLVDAQIEATVQSIALLQLSGEVASEGTARILQKASPPLGPTNASTARNMVLGLIVGAVLGVVAALIRDQLDRSVNTSEDVQKLGLTVLGTIPKAGKKASQDLAQVSLHDPHNPIADAYQRVRSALQFLALDTDTRSILVTSPTAGNGKTTTAVNLALAFSSVDHKVVLVDADFRRPMIHRIFNTNLVPGVTDALVQGIPLDRIAVATSLEARASLAALPAGTEPPNPATFLASPLFDELHAQLRAKSDMVVFDAPPVLPVADATSLCPDVDGVVLVVEAGQTTRDQLASAIEIIDRAGGLILGVVLAKSKATSKAYYQYGGRDSPPERSRPPQPIDLDQANGYASEQDTSDATV